MSTASSNIALTSRDCEKNETYIKVYGNCHPDELCSCHHIARICQAHHDENVYEHGRYEVLPAGTNNVRCGFHVNDFTFHHLYNYPVYPRSLRILPQRGTDTVSCSDRKRDGPDAFFNIPYTGICVADVYSRCNNSRLENRYQHDPE